MFPFTNGKDYLGKNLDAIRSTGHAYCDWINGTAGQTMCWIAVSWCLFSVITLWLTIACYRSLSHHITLEGRAAHLQILPTSAWTFSLGRDPPESKFLKAALSRLLTEGVCRICNASTPVTGQAAAKRVMTQTRLTNGSTVSPVQVTQMRITFNRMSARSGGHRRVRRNNGCKENKW
jgi:hypothetical protein